MLIGLVYIAMARACHACRGREQGTWGQNPEKQGEQAAKRGGQSGVNNMGHMRMMTTAGSAEERGISGRSRGAGQHTQEKAARVPPTCCVGLGVGF